VELRQHHDRVDVASDDVTLISAPLFHVAALNQTLLPTT